MAGENVADYKRVLHDETTGNIASARQDMLRSFESVKFTRAEMESIRDAIGDCIVRVGRIVASNNDVLASNRNVADKLEESSRVVFGVGNEIDDVFEAGVELDAAHIYMNDSAEILVGAHNTSRKLMDALFDANNLCKQSAGAYEEAKESFDGADVAVTDAQERIEGWIEGQGGGV